MLIPPCGWKNREKMGGSPEGGNATFKCTEYPGVGRNSWNHAHAEWGLVPWLLGQHSRP